MERGIIWGEADGRAQGIIQLDSLAGFPTEYRAEGVRKGASNTRLTYCSPGSGLSIVPDPGTARVILPGTVLVHFMDQSATALQYTVVMATCSSHSNAKKKSHSIPRLGFQYCSVGLCALHKPQPASVGQGTRVSNSVSRDKGKTRASLKMPAEYLRPEFPTRLI
jgi:hypothetical protein